MTDRKKLKILVITNSTASRAWRFDGYQSRIAADGHNMQIIEHSEWSNDTYGADVVIFEMSASPNSVAVAKRQGAKVIYEADDAVIDAYGKERKNLMHIGEAWKNSTIETVNACDAVIVTNYFLKKNFETFTRKDMPIYIVPNYIDFDWYKDVDWGVERNSNEIRVGWFGSRGHFEDLRMILPAIKEVLEKYPNAKLIYQGYGGMSSDKKMTEIGWGEDVFREIPRNRREFSVAVNHMMWPDKHRALDLDIGLAPLIDDVFNHCKTNIKWQEYAALKTPVVASPTVYGEHPIFEGVTTITHGYDGMIANNHEEWVRWLSMLIEDPKFRRKMGKTAYKKVKSDWDLDKHWRFWINDVLDVYEQKQSEPVENKVD